MNHSQSVSAIARRLRGLKQRGIDEVLTLLIELWGDTLVQPGGYIRIRGLGKVYVETQQLRSAGAVRQHLQRQQKEVSPTLTRCYVRFRPTAAFRQRLVAQRQEEQKRP